MVTSQYFAPKNVERKHCLNRVKKLLRIYSVIYFQERLTLLCMILQVFMLKKFIVSFDPKSFIHSFHNLPSHIVIFTLDILWKLFSYSFVRDCTCKYLWRDWVYKSVQYSKIQQFIFGYGFSACRLQNTYKSRLFKTGFRKAFFLLTSI